MSPRSRFLFAGFAAGLSAVVMIATAYAQRQREALDRGVVALRQDDGRV